MFKNSQKPAYLGKYLSSFSNKNNVMDTLLLFRFYVHRIIQTLFLSAKWIYKASHRHNFLSQPLSISLSSNISTFNHVIWFFWQFAAYHWTIHFDHDWFTLSPICWLLNMEDKEFAFYHHPFLIFPLPSLSHYKCRYILTLVSFIFHIYVVNTNHTCVYIYAYMYIIIIAESSNSHNYFSFPVQYYFPYTLFYHLVRLLFYLLLIPYSYSLSCWHLMTCGNMLIVSPSFSRSCLPWHFWPSPI